MVMIDQHKIVCELLKESITAHKAAVIELEWLAERANRAANIARDKLITLELKFQDFLDDQNLNLDNQEKKDD